MDNLYDTLKDAMSSVLANVHTVLIARITAVNEATINAKPVINRVVDNASIELPEFIEIPVINIQGGGSYLAMPLAIGDYCMLLITERCFDRWWNGEDNIEPLEMRMFDYSDAIALVGINNKNGLIAIPTTATFQGDLIVNGNITVNGDITCNGTITATVDVIGGGISLKNHTHGNVQNGTGTTSVPS